MCSNSTLTLSNKSFGMGQIKEEERKVLKEQIRSYRALGTEIPLLQEIWDEEQKYVDEAFAFQKKQWEQRR